MARPTKLTPELQRSIYDLLLQGNFVETVCDFVGIHKDTFYDWIKRGERGWKADRDGGYVEFSDAIKKAVSLIEMQTMTELKSGGMNWQAKAWWLERRHPDKWGNRGKSQVEHSGANGGPIHTVNQTLNEWRAEQSKRRTAAAQTMADLDADDDDE